MINIDVPGKGKYTFKHLVLDFNGTIAYDGRLIDGVEKRLTTLANDLMIYVITADTNGSVVNQCRDLPVNVQIIANDNQLEKKRDFIKRLNLNGTIAMGNGVNDQYMLREADLAIAIIGREGCATSTLMVSDIVVQNILDGLDLILKHNRLIATLRK